MYLQKVISRKNSFLLASWRSMMKIAGSRAGSIRQRHGSPDQNTYLCATDHQHCSKLIRIPRFEDHISVYSSTQLFPSCKDFWVCKMEPLVSLRPRRGAVFFQQKAINYVGLSLSNENTVIFLGSFKVHDGLHTIWKADNQSASNFSRLQALQHKQFAQFRVGGRCLFRGVRAYFCRLFFFLNICQNGKVIKKLEI